MALDATIHRRETTWWYQFQQSPCPTLAKTIYSWRRRLALHQASKQVPEDSSDLTVVCVSDTHNSQPKTPPGDILIHAGDLTQGGTATELQAQLTWLKAQPHAYKIVIAGNHDIVLDPAKSAELGFRSGARQSLQWGSIIYLQHSQTTVKVRERTLSIYGHPSTRKHGNWAFQYDRGADVFSNRIPDDVDILVTHSPPQFHLDVAGWGDMSLLREIERVKPKLHVFGHIHGGYGQDILVYDRFERLYQDLCSGLAGLLAIFHMVYLLLHTVFAGIPRNAKRTTLVNASAVGGLREDSLRNVQTVHL
ncbi:hypothetical protein CKM354_001106400 [Cercospora kikuchii]|uniref:Calcineurin-like phosphoesterase domain-containing protein n=1 Tax=Cercospora kikuchii TaxID=84275 RepID=A0A9P3CS91_9PEZI|nr:uncharacterized protein CKM354_001106400 [Cercospora kikuchii]GIZ47989.1 hypothetical protein CKM354_001106400 [Cercospora kikuchii]